MKSAPSTDRTVVVRKVKMKVEKKSPIGAWEIFCPTCPMHPMQDALESKRSNCVAGMSTNMQGAIPLGNCKHVRNKTWDKLEVECAFQMPKVKQ